jgi:hypothetical protein
MNGDEIYDDEPDEKMLRGAAGRRCFETKMTFLSREGGGVLSPERREFHMFTHCHDAEPSFEELKRLMEYNVPMHPPPRIMSIVHNQELTRAEYLARF